jgi:hypothetical protein
MQHIRDGVLMPNKYSDDELKAKLGNSGWRLESAHKDHSLSGTLKGVLEFMHEKHKTGVPRGRIEEIETKIELDMIQIELLWRYLGLPV